ncbi:MAG: methyltransferase domain-containing protein [Ignavibacteria bacterium]|jgi:ubiquinone/menaquinone biosynthesis C-methylase UbiE|nr:methyltransferase domain-containing protein [Ignavibacteria bacterium]MCU7522365.1 methyltransferase domain-containing protein [Ignavibacteria bacterium]MCU7525955.1 methyltransferase domain-containing protein [Ignavibacteria bacterium]
MHNFLPSQFDFNNPDSVSIIDELPLWSAPFGLKLLDAIKIKPGMTVLDIGFGLGFPLIEIAQRLGRTAKLYGIDPWEAAVQRARKKISILGIENIELITGAAENIPLPNSSVDLIVSNNGINNVQDISKVFSECSRIAKPGAQFVAAVNLPETMIEFYSIFMEVLGDFNMTEKIPDIKEHIHKKRLPLQELKDLFAANNFEVAGSEVDSFRYRFVNGTAMFDYPFIRNNFMDSWLAIVPPERVNKVFNEIESRMNLISQKKGEWVLTIPLVTISAIKK